MVTGAARQPLPPPPGALDVHANCENGIVKVPVVSGVDELTESVAVRGLTACERAWASISTVFAGHVGLAGVTLVETTATPLPTLPPGTVKFTWLIVAAVLPTCRISRPPPLPMVTVAACAPSGASASATTSVRVRVMASKKAGVARAAPAFPSAFAETALTASPQYT